MSHHHWHGGICFDCGRGVSLRNGVERETIAGILILVQAYAGMPRANSAATLALDVLAKRGDGPP
jgi:alkylhydroperoxidase/carboxymuconolactone decarboxylase family protein YurZ